MSDKFTGPARRAPAFYAGETYGQRDIHYPDVERYPDHYPKHLAGKPVSKRNKIMRRLIRGALKRQFSKVERARKLGQTMLEQARLIAKENKRGSYFARRLFAKELAIHQPVYAPSDLRAERTARRAAKRRGEKTALEKLVGAMADLPGGGPLAEFYTHPYGKL